MPTNKDVNINIKGDSRGYVDAVKNMVKSVNEFGREAVKAQENTQKETKKTSKQVNILKTDIGQLASAMMGLQSIRFGTQLIENSERLRASVQALRSRDGFGGIQKDFENIENITGGLADRFNMVDSVNRAMAFGIDLSNGRLGKLINLAQKTSIVMGQDLTKSFDDLIVGVARESRLILDNLGVIISTEQATKEYAATLGKTAKELSKTERQTAILNEALKQLEKTTKNVDLSAIDQKGTKAIKKLKNTFRDFGVWAAKFFVDLGEGIGVSLGMALDFSDNKNKIGFIEAWKEGFRDITGRSLGVIEDVADKVKAKMVQQDKKSYKDLVKNFDFYLKGIETKNRLFVERQIPITNIMFANNIKNIGSSLMGFFNTQGKFFSSRYDKWVKQITKKTNTALIQERKSLIAELGKFLLGKKDLSIFKNEEEYQKYLKKRARIKKELSEFSTKELRDLKKRKDFEDGHFKYMEMVAKNTKGVTDQLVDSMKYLQNQGRLGGGGVWSAIMGEPEKIRDVYLEEENLQTQHISNMIKMALDGQEEALKNQEQYRLNYLQIERDKISKEIAMEKERADTLKGYSRQFIDALLNDNIQGFMQMLSMQAMYRGADMIIDGASRMIQAETLIASAGIFPPNAIAGATMLAAAKKELAMGLAWGGAGLAGYYATGGFGGSSTPSSAGSESAPSQQNQDIYFDVTVTNGVNVEIERQLKKKGFVQKKY